MALARSTLFRPLPLTIRLLRVVALPPPFRSRLRPGRTLSLSPAFRSKLAVRNVACPYRLTSRPYPLWIWFLVRGSTTATMSTSSRRRRSPLERSSSRSSSSASLSASSYASGASTTSPPSRLRPPPPSTSTSTSSSPPSRARTTTVSTSHVFLFLVAFRLLNALSLRTFFQPDEFFQSLEPAWQTAFGETHGAWITWVSRIIGASTHVSAE